MWILQDVLLIPYNNIPTILVVYLNTRAHFSVLSTYFSSDLDSPTYQYAQFKFANESQPNNPSYRPQPPDLQHIYNMKRQQQQLQQQQQFAMAYSQYDTPPQLPQKPKKKSSILKSPFNAIKKAFSSKSKPSLKRQNSMKETVENPIQIPISRALRRQHSMIEPSRSAGYAVTPDLSIGRRNLRGFANNPEYLTYHEPFTPSDGGAYRNLETDAIYGNCGQMYDNRIEENNLYANRRDVEMELLNQQEQQYQETTDGAPKENRIRRRHSMAERHAGAPKDSRTFMNGRYDVPPPPEPVEQREDIYQTRSGAFLLDSVTDRRRFTPTPGRDEIIYQSRKEMHRDHLYQSRDEMHKRLQQGREDEGIRNSQLLSRERAEDEIDDEVVVVKDQLVYQSRKELKERGFKTRTQLRDHIYQSRLEAMQSMAEPVYVSKSELQNRIVEESTEQPSQDEDLDKHSVSSNHDLSLKAVIDHLDNGFIENEHNDSGENETHNATVTSCEEDEVTLTNSNQSDIQKSAYASVTDQTVPMVAPMTPRSVRDPFHISNIIKRTAPPASPIMAPAKSAIASSNHQHPHASQTSIETQFTSATVSSLASLPTGPPNAQSTPYTSHMALPASFYPPLREQTTTSGIFDENGGTLSDTVWNVSIHIPPGSIPTGRQQEIYFTVTDPRLSQTVGGPPLDMENGWST